MYFKILLTLLICSSCFAQRKIPGWQGITPAGQKAIKDTVRAIVSDSVIDVSVSDTLMNFKGMYGADVEIDIRNTINENDTALNIQTGSGASGKVNIYSLKRRAGLTNTTIEGGVTRIDEFKGFTFNTKYDYLPQYTGPFTSNTLKVLFSQADSLQDHGGFPYLEFDGDTVIAAFRVAKQHAADTASAEIWIKKSGDRGATWGSKIVAIDSSNAFDPHSSPLLLMSDDSLLMLVNHIQDAADTDRDIFAYKSGDRGKTWTTPVSITSGLPTSTYTCANRPIELSNGKVAFSFYAEEAAQVNTLFFVDSDDFGKTWNTPDTIYTESTSAKDVAEPGLIEMPGSNGMNLWGVCREQKTGGVYPPQYWSTDGGATWSTSNWIDYTENAPVNIVRYSNNRLMVMYHGSNTRYSGTSQAFRISDPVADGDTIPTFDEGLYQDFYLGYAGGNRIINMGGGDFGLGIMVQSSGSGPSYVYFDHADFGFTNYEILNSNFKAGNFRTYSSLTMDKASENSGFATFDSNDSLVVYLPNLRPTDIVLVDYYGTPNAATLGATAKQNKVIFEASAAISNTIQYFILKRD